MANAPIIAMAVAIAIPIARDTVDAKSAAPAFEQRAHALLTPPESVSPGLPAHANPASSPPMETLREQALEDDGIEDNARGHVQAMRATPLSKGALSGLDASAAITSAMLAKHYLPDIMLGNGPVPIRNVIGELMRLVPGFSRIPPAKARRLVVGALEGRAGGGVDGSVAFSKTGWGRWDAHIKGSSKDSAIGSFNDGHLSPPRSEHSSFAFSQQDSAVHMPRPKPPAAFRDHHSRGSWASSSRRIAEEEPDVDMDMPEYEADKMSLDGDSADDDDDDAGDSSSINDETDDEDWAAVGADALRKASLPAPDLPRRNYNALSVPYVSRWPTTGWNRRPSGLSDQSRPANLHSASLPSGNAAFDLSSRGLDQAVQTPEEKAAIAALLSMGSH